jgi:vancomycin resistance protein YoaR
MARTALTITTLKQNNYAVQAGDLAVTLASDTVNLNAFNATGREILIVQNTDTAAHTFTVTSVADALGRTGDIAAYSVPATSVAAIEASVLAGWKQADGNIYLASTNALLTFGALRFT